MEEYSSEDGIASIEAKLDFLIHHLNQRIQNDSLMEQEVLPYDQVSSTPTFQKEEELFLAKEQNFTDMDENKKMSSHHE